MTFSPNGSDQDDDDVVSAWQLRALDRSLGAARARSVQRLGQFVQAARELATETGSATFTVQQVVDGSGQSLKSFYRLFAGKDDLLLALLEEDCAVGALFLAEMVARHRSPVRRMQAWVEGMFELLAAGEHGYVTVLVREHLRLSESRPEQMAEVLRPFLEILATDIAVAMDAGNVRPGNADRDARSVFDLVLANIHHLVPGHAGETPQQAARYVWRFCWGGMQTGDARG